MIQLKSESLRRIIRTISDSSVRISVPFQKLSDDARTPIRANKTDVGYDLYAVEDGVIECGKVSEFKTGLALEIPPNFYAQIAPRSGLGKKGVIVLGGVIDASYRGEIIVLISKITPYPNEHKVNKGDKIAQLIFLPKADVDFRETGLLSETDRGTGGFGSTGN